MKAGLTLLVVLTFFQNGEIAGTVIGVEDGDTVEVMLNNQKTKIRIFGIDSPEDGQAFSGKAKQYATVLCLNKKVKVIKHDAKDSFGRIVGEVILEDGRSVGKELVAAGYTWVYRKFTNDPDMIRLEEEARKQKKGLWIEENPTPPWDFRKNKTAGN
ncbi:MAG TPA: thermonuclease family protein [Chryseosolibacter sp.]|nr:thermonuclease family protein [Chryseosolibacter sp.]